MPKRGRNTKKKANNEPPPKKQKLNNNDKFLETLKVRKYAITKLEELEKEYKSEIDKREHAKSIIIKSTESEQYRDRYPDFSNIESEKHKLWTKYMPSEILKLIFIDTVFNPDIYDKTVLHLILVCKDWRFTIFEYENDETFEYRLWYPLLNKFKHSYFEWKHLVLIPDKYLKIIYNIPITKSMTTEECKYYDKLINKVYDDHALCFNANTNIPLLIGIMQKCPKLYGIELFGDLCEDLFFVIGEKLIRLGSITFTYTTNGKSEWFKHFIYRESEICKTLKYINIDCSYWINDEAMLYLSDCSNMISIAMQKSGNISFVGIEYIFKGCKELLSIDVFKGYFRGSLCNAFKILAKNNKVIQRIELDCGWDIDDKCLDELMNKNNCPELETLILNGSECSEKKKKKFKRKRPNVDFYA